VNRRALVIRQATCDVKHPKNQTVSFSFGTTGLTLVTDNCESLVEVMILITGNDLKQLLSEQSNLYHCQKFTKMESLAENTDVVQYHT